ncbi:MAG: glycerophosphodiester phosphodiesterase [Thermoleophilia bacterium]|nr:glycerophosphodiester phosphodiesterase [Thermoleophilia bacterium]
MIDLSRRNGRLRRIGHRGAPALAPENTLHGFRAAIAAGVEVVEFDVVGGRRGPLLVGHSEREATEAGSEAPTLDEVLGFFAEEAREIGLHVDLKLRVRLPEVAAALARHGLAHRTVVSSWSPRALRTIGRAEPEVRLGITYPRDRIGVARRPGGQALSSVGLAVLRARTPRRLVGLLRRSGATAVMLHHQLATREAVLAAHTLGAAVVVWTIDERADLARVAAAGVDGVITNDPRLFAD